MNRAFMRLFQTNIVNVIFSVDLPSALLLKLQLGLYDTN